MAANHGLVSRRQAVGAGMTGPEIDRLVRTGRWTIVRRGVYAESEFAAALTTPTAKQRLKDRAACLAISVPFVRSHQTAALELSLPVLLPSRPMTHVTRPCVGTHNRWGVKHHLAPYRDEEVSEVNGFRVLGAARTAIDVARELGSPYGEATIDGARHRGVTITELENVIDRMAHWPDRRRAITCLEQSDGGAESVGETLARRLVEGLGLGEVHTQFGLADGRREAWADLRVGRHLFEFDGRLKYLGRAAGGLSPRTADEVVWEEKRREDWLRGFRLGVTRLTWEDVWGPGTAAAAIRARRDYEATTRLWGTSIADLDRYIIRGRRPAA